MHTLSGGTFVRQKAIIETVFEMDTPVTLSHPREGIDGSLYVCSHGGEILKFTDEGEYGVFKTLGGMPNCIAIKKATPEQNEEQQPQDQQQQQQSQEQGEDIYIADISNCMVYEKKYNAELGVFFKSYESLPLKGPSSLILNQKENYLLVSDSGHFGSTSLNNPNGSLFHIDLETSMCKPILLNCLAYPSDIFYDESTDMIYICETYRNRVLRIAQNPLGIFHCSVFHTFNGRVGPTAIAIDEVGNIYVSRYEFQHSKNEVDGIISILNKEGNEIGELVVPGKSEINGMLIPRNKNTSNIMYFTVKNGNGVWRIKLSQLAAEIDKMQG